MKIASIALALIALSGCSVRHYAVCMQTATGTGCSHQQFSKATATDIGKLLSSQPIEEEIKVWLMDMTKHSELRPTQVKPEDHTHDDDNKL